MPEESKKNQQKGPKDQRKSRNRHQAGSAEKKNEKKVEKVEEPKVPPKPKHEEPGPEFYKNLKRETDEILKITEEENSKYKKKEILSNWSKYEMPIESYDEIEEQENMGADYEKLIEAPLSVGGHFQFKHEKSWDVDTGPSLYDKYFEVNMDNLFVSIATIPFHDRINVSKTIFTETDMLSMNNRAMRFKQKYYNDRKFTTPELTVQDNILSSLKENIEKVECAQNDEECDNEDLETQQEVMFAVQEKTIDSINLETHYKAETDITITETKTNKLQGEPLNVSLHKLNEDKPQDNLDSFDDLILVGKDKKSLDIENKDVINKKELEKAVTVKQGNEKSTLLPSPETNQKPENPVIESPEDLEKWLDDFLDG